MHFSALRVALEACCYLSGSVTACWAEPQIMAPRKAPLLSRQHSVRYHGQPLFGCQRSPWSICLYTSPVKAHHIISNTQRNYKLKAVARRPAVAIKQAHGQPYCSHSIAALVRRWILDRRVTLVALLRPSHSRLSKQAAKNLRLIWFGSDQTQTDLRRWILLVFCYTSNLRDTVQMMSRFHFPPEENSGVQRLKTQTNTEIQWNSVSH